MEIEINSKIFHNRASMRRKRNEIKCLEASDGSVVTKDEDIAGVVVNYYDELFSSSGPDEDDMRFLTDVLRDKVPEQLQNVFDFPFNFLQKKLGRLYFRCTLQKLRDLTGFNLCSFKSYGAS